MLCAVEVSLIKRTAVITGRLQRVLFTVSFQQVTGHAPIITTPTSVTFVTYERTGIDLLDRVAHLPLSSLLSLLLMIRYHSLEYSFKKRFTRLHLSRFVNEALKVMTYFVVTTFFEVMSTITVVIYYHDHKEISIIIQLAVTDHHRLPSYYSFNLLPRHSFKIYCTVENNK